MRTAFRITPVLGLVMLGLGLGVSSCGTLLSEGSAKLPTVLFRIENATASTVELTIEAIDHAGNPLVVTLTEPPTVEIPVVTVTPDGVETSVLTPVGAAASLVDQATADSAAPALKSAATVRLLAFWASLGELACGPVMKISGVIQGTDLTLQLAGEGTGTPGFDAGTVGADGERYLLADTDYACGDIIVIRVDDDGTGVGTSTGLTARGRVAVVGPNEDLPFEPFSPGTGSTGDSADTGDAGSNGSADTGSAGASTVRIEIENLTTSIAAIDLAIGESASETEEFTVNVPPNVVTGGDFNCGLQLTFTARFPNTDRPPVSDLEDIYPDATIVLTGDGTGALGFDEASVGATGQRYLLRDTHFACGDTVALSIVDDTAVVAPEGFNAQGQGLGRVAVTTGGTSTGSDGSAEDATTPESAADPDMSILVNNLTGDYVHVSVVSGATSLGKTTDVFVPPNEQSSGLLSCADRYTVTAYSLAVGALTGLLDEVLVVLQGEGTGASGFDAGSVGSLGQRLLVRTTHYACGDTIEVTVTDPGAPGFTEPSYVDTNGISGFTDLNGNGIQDLIPDQLGAGEVQVDSAAP